MEPSEDLLDERKQRKLAQMSRREEERKLEVQTKQDERNLTSSTTTGRKAFEQDYPQLKNQVDELFQRLAINREETSVQELFDQLQKLEKFITEHVDILRPRDLANAQADVLKLRSQLNLLQDQTLSTTHRIDFTKSEEETKPTDSVVVVDTKVGSKNDVLVSSNTVMICNRENELIRLNESDLTGKDVAIENLNQCEVFLKGVPSSLQIKNLQASILVVGPCSRSILIDQCQRCEFALACQQLRIHRSSECDFYVHITAQPIIEDCHQCRFAPYNVNYQLKDEHIRASALLWNKDYWNDVRDFNHMILGMPSPNWSIIEEEERKEWSLD